MNAWLRTHHGSTQWLTDNSYIAEITAAATGNAYGTGDGLYEAAANSAKVEPACPSPAPSKPQLSEEGSAIANSAFKSEQPEEIYEKWAATYDADSAAVGFDSPHTSAAQTLAFWPRVEETGVVAALDIGCGTGDLVERLLRSLTPSEAAATTFYGFDLSAPMLSIAEKRGNYAQLHRQSCSEVWPYADASIDIAFCNGVLIYVQNGKEREVVISELARVLKPGGHAVLMIREDNIAQWHPIIDHAEAKAQLLRLVHTTAPRNNFPNKPFGEEIYYRQYVFQRDVARSSRARQSSAAYENELLEAAA